MCPTLPDNPTQFVDFKSCICCLIFQPESYISQTIKSEWSGRVRFVSLDVPEARQVRSSYKSVLKASLPIDIPRNSQTQQPEQDVFRSAIDDSGWLQQVWKRDLICVSSFGKL